MLLPGQRVGQRFVVHRLAATGGMGSLYEAMDEATGDRVALKVARLGQASTHARFAREAGVLRQLSHPHIVRYVDHGVADDASLYLAMEWLDGEDLGQRLERGALEDEEVRAIASHTAEALAYAHAQGIIHRDVKPGNLFLVGGDSSRLKLVDFGIAQLDGRTAITRYGSVIGTPGYMAPEQARGASNIDARADLFALGCVLFECATGSPAFVAHDALALLFKILVEDPPSLTDLRPDLSPALTGLVAQMLAKDVDVRPASAQAVLAALAQDHGSAPIGSTPSSASLTSGEQHLVCIIVASGLGTIPTDETAPTLHFDDHTALRESAVDAARPFGAQVEWLADGGMIAVLRGADSASEQVALAAACALSLRDVLGDRPVAIATGRAELRAALPVGPVVERAVELVRSIREEPSVVVVDETTERLIEQRFEVRDARLIGRRAEPSLRRTLLGKPTPCVGRDRELARLDEATARCVEDRALELALVTGPAGIGKSRLVDEHLARLTATWPRAVVWRASADPLRSGAPLLLLSQALRSAARIPDGLGRPEALEKLRDVVRGRIEESRTVDVEHLFAEIVAAEHPDNAPRTAERSDPAQAGERIRRGLAAFLDAALASRPEPLVIVLEDLHWSDSASLRLLDGVLAAREHGAPIRVLAVARPEVRELYPWLFRRRDVDELRLTALRAGPASSLVRHSLGEQLDPATCERIVARASGNPFYLEELVRAVAQGRGESLPETVIAVTLERLETLEPAARRVLRAASILGEWFAEDAVSALIPTSEDAGAWLARLAEDEVLARDDRELSARRTYRFRHAYLREAAYSTLTPSDRVLGHRLAAELLDERGGEEPSVVAEHYERAGDPRAARFYLSAARKALRASDLEGSIALAERGTRSAGDGAPAVVQDLLRLQAGAQSWRGDFRAVEGLSDRMLRAAAVGSKPWWSAVASAVHAGIFLARPRKTREALTLLCDTPPQPDALLAYGRAVGAALPVAYSASAHASCALLHTRFEMGAAPLAAREPLVRAMLVWMASYRAFCRDDDPWEALRGVREARELFQEAGDTQRASIVTERHPSISATSATSKPTWPRPAACSSTLRTWDSGRRSRSASSRGIWSSADGGTKQTSSSRGRSRGPLAVASR